MKVTNPKLTLYAFHLRNNLAQGEEKPVNDANHLWEQCQRLGQKLNIPQLQSLLESLQDSNGNIGMVPSKDNPKSDYLELLPQRSLDFSAIPDGSTLQLRGEVYPLQIHDTYAVDITLRYPYPHVEIEQLADLNPQGCLRITQSKSLLGQTLVLFVQPEDEIQDIQAFANECLAAILASERQQYLLSTQGKFLGSPIFEYENIQETTDQPSHILIWLNCNNQTETLEEAGDYYQPLINLLCCRSKILYTYAESRWCNQQARVLYRQLEDKVQGFRQLPSDPDEKLKQLEGWLTEIPKTAFGYANYLRDLEIYRIAIEINCKNYKSCLKHLETSSIDGENNLEIWQKFINQVQEKIIKQINFDLSYLLPSKPFFQQMIDAVRGIVEKEQAQSDRAAESTAQKRQQRLELLITVASTGLALSGISSQVANEPAKTILTQLFPAQFRESSKPESLSYLVTSFSPVVFHLLVGVIFAIPLGGIVWGIQTDLIGKIRRFIKKLANRHP